MSIPSQSVALVRAFIRLICLAALLAAAFAVPAPVQAQTESRYIALTPRSVKGVLHTPSQGPAPRIGILVMHEDSNFLAHIACGEFAKRGFAAMCVNGRSDNNEALDMWNDLPLDTALGMRYLREKVKVEKVVIFAHSGGGPLLSFYQSVAENGPGVCSDAAKLSTCDESLRNLPKADAMVFFDAHPGTAINLLRSLDPSIVSEDQPTSTNPALDPFNPANGFRAKGSSKYSADFQKRYYAAQAQRMNKLIAIAVERRNLMKAGKYPFPDDDVFMIPRANARLMELDSSIEPGTHRPRKLLRNDGSVVEQIVKSVRRTNPRRAKTNRTFDGGKLLTIHSFLGTRAVRSTDSMYGIDIASNNNSTGASLKRIHVPILMMTAGGHYFIRDNEEMFDMAASADKDFIVVEGAAHGIVPCTRCSRTKGAFSNSVRNTFDYAKAWIDKRF